MISEQILKNLLSNCFLEEACRKKYFITQELGQWIVYLSSDQVTQWFKHVKQSKRFDFLINISGVDYSKKADTKITQKFGVVYELFSSLDASRLRIKVGVSEGEEIPSITPIWKGANWFEREIYDMFGLVFTGHPYLHRLLTHHQFKGHPLRKDYPADYNQACTESLPIHFADDKPDLDPNSSMVPLNIGPSHPATHGTLRVMCELDGEKVNRANVEIGYLHRCFEKMAETHPYNQVIPYTDRLNYCSAPINNVAYCKTVEKLLGVTVPLRAQAMRIILMELSRIIDHIVCVAANAVDLGALTGFFHLFTYRERVYSLFEKLCGARLTVSLTRIGGMAQDAPDEWFKEVLQFCKDMSKGVNELDQLLTGNKIWISRTKDIGKITTEEAVAWGYTGPLLRATGMSLDLRKDTPYYGYETLDFNVPIGSTGDLYDRYLVRVAEMRESIKIIEQLCKSMPSGDYIIRDKSIVLPEKKDVYGNIESLMNHFMLIIKGIKNKPLEVYDSVEAANGELGFYLISDGSACPYRLKVRPPCFAIYQSFPERVIGAQVADVIAILGSMNVIAGELDR